MKNKINYIKNYFFNNIEDLYYEKYIRSSFGRLLDEKIISIDIYGDIYSKNEKNNLIIKFTTEDNHRFYMYNDKADYVNFNFEGNLNTIIDNYIIKSKESVERIGDDYYALITSYELLTSCGKVRFEWQGGYNSKGIFFVKSKD